MTRADGKPADILRVKPLLEDAFHAVWRGQAESDGFNRLTIAAGLAWRDITILRAVAKFLRQAGINLSQTYIESAFAKNPQIASALVELFRTLHDPDLFRDTTSRRADATRIRDAIQAALADVPSADDDRIIRAALSVIDAMLRTSFFQLKDDGNAKPFLAFKLDSRKLDMLPAPKPLCEIFVYSPEFEGVHLRFGRIARGGIRWSDRPEDFRTEILSLVKAQQVKNCRDRARRREGRLLSEAAAARRHARSDPGRGHQRVQDLRRRAARSHRQYRPGWARDPTAPGAAPRR